MGKFLETWILLLNAAADSKKEFLRRMEKYMIYLSEEDDYKIVQELMKDIHDKREIEMNRLKSFQGQRGEIPSDKQVIKNHFHLI